MSKLTADQDRVFNVLLDTARELHRANIQQGRGWLEGHTALTEIGQDVECLFCGHINEAEYELAKATMPGMK